MDCQVCQALRELAVEIPYPFLDIEPPKVCFKCQEEEWDKEADLLSLL